MKSAFFNQAMCPSCAIVFNVPKLTLRLRSSSVSPSKRGSKRGTGNPSDISHNNFTSRTITNDKVHASSGSQPRQSLVEPNRASSQTEPSFKFEIDNKTVGLRLNVEIETVCNLLSPRRWMNRFCNFIQKPIGFPFLDSGVQPEPPKNSTKATQRSKSQPKVQ